MAVTHVQSAIASWANILMGVDPIARTLPGATTSGNLLVGLVWVLGLDTSPVGGVQPAVISAPTGWTAFTTNPTSDEYGGGYLFGFYKTADGTETGISIPAANYNMVSADGSVYVGEFSGVAAGTAHDIYNVDDQAYVGVAGGFDFRTPGGAECASQIALVDSLCFAVWGDDSTLATTVTWNPADLSGDFVSLTQRTVSSGNEGICSVLPFYAAISDLIPKVDGEADQYGSSGQTYMVYTEAPTAAAPEPAPSAPSYVPRGRKVFIEELPYSVGSHQPRRRR
jgi:hypothetical protein